MPDISKCCNTKCPRREECFSYRVKPSEYRQAYAPFTGENCFVSLDGWNEGILIPKGALVKNMFEKGDGDE